MNFPLRTAFTVSHRFWVVVFSFSFVSMQILISILIFILIWVAVPIGCLLIALVLAKALDVVNLGWLNHLLGAMLGALKVMLLVGLGIYVLEYIDPKSKMVSKSTKRTSLLYSPMKDMVNQCLPVVKGLTEELKDVTDKMIK